MTAIKCLAGNYMVVLLCFSSLSTVFFHSFSIYFICRDIMWFIDKTATVRATQRSHYISQCDRKAFSIIPSLSQRSSFRNCQNWISLFEFYLIQQNSLTQLSRFRCIIACKNFTHTVLCAYWSNEWVSRAFLKNVCAPIHHTSLIRIYWTHAFSMIFSIYSWANYPHLEKNIHWETKLFKMSINDGKLRAFDIINEDTENSGKGRAKIKT